MGKERDCCLFRLVTAEVLFRLLVQIGDGNSCSQNSIIRMINGHSGCYFRSQSVQFYCSYPWV